MYKYVVRPLLFLINAESAHHLTFNFLATICRVPAIRSLIRWIFQYQHPSLAKTLFGLRFNNPIGLAAGFDKDARLIDELDCLGFGFIEIGTVTPRPQPGNEKPRLFRLPKDKALINRMGFNNNGVSNAVTRLSKRKSSVIVGGNIGKNKSTPNQEAFADYAACFEALYGHVDYFVVNVSSPNTPGLRELQEKEPLRQLLTDLCKLRETKAAPKPILLKIAPDLDNHQLDDIVEIVKATGIDGVVATNTSVSREGLRTSPQVLERIGNGGVSGAPVTARATEVIRYLRAALGPELPIIGVGGIMSVADAIEKLDAGASLIQVYTGFIYEGPAFVRRINKALVRHVPSP